MYNAQRWGNLNRAPPSPSAGVAGGSSPGRLAENGRFVLNPLHLCTSGYTQSRPWPPTQTQGGGHSKQPFDYYVTRGPNNITESLGNSLVVTMHLAHRRKEMITDVTASETISSRIATRAVSVQSLLRVHYLSPQEKREHDDQHPGLPIHSFDQTTR